jgi:hypothetical protein
MNRFASKRILLSGISFLLLILFITSGWNWYEVSTTTQERSVVLSQFDGYSAYPWIAPLLLVALASFSLASLLKTGVRGIVFGIGSAFSFLLGTMALMAISNQDLGGLKSQLESLTGIVVTHGLENFQVTTMYGAYISLAGFFLLSSLLLLSSLAQSKWVKVAGTASIKLEGKAPTDSISLWDEQR